MLRKWWSCVAPFLAAVLLLALADVSFGASVRSVSRPLGGNNSFGSYFYPLYSQPVLPASSNPADDDYTYGASAEMGNNAMLLILRLPANAEVWIEGSKTVQTGNFRSFISPPLQAGQDYSYDIRARWMQGGLAIEQSRTIIVRAGDRLTLSLTADRTDNNKVKK
jgi:uncharacterized protein (TIGR03000 family)